MARKKNPWNKLTISIAIHKDVDADALIKNLQKFCGPKATLVKTCPQTFIPLGSHVVDLTPQELTQVALITSKGAVYGHPL